MSDGSRYLVRVLWYIPQHNCIIAHEISLTIMLVEPVYKRAHLIIPQLDRTIMKRGGKEGSFGVCQELAISSNPLDNCENR